MLLTDGQGSTVQRAGPDGSLVEDFVSASGGGGGSGNSGVPGGRYDAFGQAVGFVASAAGTELLYTGERFDGATGDYDLRARRYDAGVGVFTAADPFAGYLSQPATLHDYGYCAGNPVNFTDPSGYLFNSLSMLGWRLSGTAQTATIYTMTLGFAGVMVSGVGRELESRGIIKTNLPWDQMQGVSAMTMFLGALGYDALQQGYPVPYPSGPSVPPGAARPPAAPGNRPANGLSVGDEPIAGDLAWPTATTYPTTPTAAGGGGRSVIPQSPTPGVQSLGPSIGTANKVPQVTANRIAGNAFRDELANGLANEGRQVATEVYKRTPFGKRIIDIEVSQDGRVLGGIETKVGSSPYTPLQRLKDSWLWRVQNYKVDVVRKP